MNKKCPRCGTSDKKKWAKNGYRNCTYCKACNRYYNELKRNKSYDKIMKATNNGECWWVLQSINADRHYRKNED